VCRPVIVSALMLLPNLSKKSRIENSVVGIKKGFLGHSLSSWRNTVPTEWRSPACAGKECRPAASRTWPFLKMYFPARPFSFREEGCARLFPSIDGRGAERRTSRIRPCWPRSTFARMSSGRYVLMSRYWILRGGRRCRRGCSVLGKHREVSYHRDSFENRA